MIDKNKIVLMTGVSIYEQSEGKSELSVNGYFRSDYIGFEIFKAALFGTIGFLILFAMYMLYDLEMFMVDFYKMDIVQFARDVLQKYIIFIAIYIVISYFVALYRYRMAKKHVGNYKEALKALYSYYR